MAHGTLRHAWLDRHATSSTSSGSPSAHDEKKQGKPSTTTARLKRLWAKTDITVRVWQTMTKGALAPTIAIAAYQSEAWSHKFTTIGYLVGVVAVLSLVIQPRAKFLQSMLINISCATMGICISLLAYLCTTTARQYSGGASTSRNTGTPVPGAKTAGYNSSASAVAGVWLFVWIFLISVIRAKLPQWTIPCMLWGITANIAMTYAPQFAAMSEAIPFALRMYEAQLTGFGIASGVSLFVFPLTSRQVAFDDMRAYFVELRRVLDTNMEYMKSLESEDMFAAQRTNTKGEKSQRSPEAQALKAASQDLTSALAKLHTNLTFAKREFAWGKMGPDDLKAAFGYMRDLSIPAVELNVMSDIFDRLSQDRGWDRSKSFAFATPEDARTEQDRFRIDVLNEWHELIGMLKGPFGEITDVIQLGLRHVEMMLDLQKARTRDRDQEAAEGGPRPGDAEFSQWFNKRSKEFLESKKTMLRGWCKVHGIDLPDDFFNDPENKDFEAPAWMNDAPMSETRRRTRRQLMIMLYFEHLLYETSRKVYAAMIYVDELKASGKMRRNRLIVPGYKRFRSWVYQELFTEQRASDDHDNADDTTVKIELGEGFKQKRDPDHLPPVNFYERMGDRLRIVAHFFASSEAHFAFRVAIGTCIIAIVNQLSATQRVFTKNRFFWAQIMVTIAMSPSAGQSFKTYLLRSLGTLISLIFSLIAWYIVNGHPAGVLIFFFIFCQSFIWVMATRPSILPIGQICQVTMVIIIGYELQANQIGHVEAQANGQEYYPIYILGPIRLATVLVGLLVAWFFTIFPYPITEHARMRKSLGSAFYLLANYYSVAHETLKLRLAGELGDMDNKNSPGRRLAKSRQKVYAKCNSLLASLRAQSDIVKYDIPVGGKFPTDQYEHIINLLGDTLNFMALIATTSASFADEKRGNQENNMRWLNNLRRIVGEANLSSQAVTSVLTLLSAAIINKQALPPYVRLPEPFALSQRLDAIDSDVLNVRHIAEPGYASFACIQIVTKNLNDEMKDLLGSVKELVGELDFSYHIVSTKDEEQHEEEGTLRYVSRTNTGAWG